MITIKERRDGKVVRLQAVIYALRPGQVKAERFRLNAPKSVTSKSGALRWAEQVRRDIEAGKPPPQTREGRARVAETAAQKEQTAASKAREAKTMAEVVEEYLTDCRARRVRETTIRMRRRRLQHLLVADEGRLAHRRVADFCELDWQKLRRHLAGHKASTADGIVQLVAGVLRFAHRAGYRRDFEAPAKIRPEARIDPDEETEAYTVDEYERLVAAARTISTSHLAVILLGGDAGLRAGEIAGLQAGDVEGGVLTVRRTIVVLDGQRIEHLPKSGKTRQVPVSDRLLGVLRLLAERSPDGWLLRSQIRQEPANVDHVDVYTFGVQRLARMPQKGPHKLRHTFATHALEAGATPKELQELLGHASLAQVERYTHRTRPRSATIDRMARYRSEAADTSVARPLTVVTA